MAASQASSYACSTYRLDCPSSSVRVSRQCSALFSQLCEGHPFSLESVKLILYRCVVRHTYQPPLLSVEWNGVEDC